MFALLEKLLAFILEGAKGSPSDAVGESPRGRSGKKLSQAIAVILIFIAGGLYTWYESHTKTTAAVAKLKAEQQHKKISELNRVITDLKEDRIRMSVELKGALEKLDEKTDELSRLQRSFERLQEDLKEAGEISQHRMEEINKLNHEIENLERAIANYVRDNRLIWDEIVSLGKEEGT